MNKFECGSVFEAKAEVMANVGYCLKTTSKGLNYSYAGEADLIAALRPELIRCGLVLSPVNVETLPTERYQTARGHGMVITRLVVTYRLTHAPSASYEDIMVYGEAADSGDKSGPKAMTMAYKYALRQAFVIETGDDPDRFASQPAVVEVSQEETFNAARAALLGANDLETLEKYRANYLQRDVTKDQIVELDKVYTKQVKKCTDAISEGVEHEVSQSS
jgi:hypothetical protein